jgi:hypothetical protein
VKETQNDKYLNLTPLSTTNFLPPSFPDSAPPRRACRAQRRKAGAAVRKP